ncbi:Predicted arabinose efflux permease, MFS family [Rhodococcoides kroppenstedtii]|uniref:Predicted arabinose efflux permease, MFS family n=1 Tax=Rhodococcoides kroppenstedtii TaxID=293050 RepID=A0A1I0TRP9_9NOCA|nr:MFS transporter [Rhodococcus kroppenstedtii]SFA54428.1 Predicted arabinose efflux permease, MFS family [Rhodococcus kroppenstedtii]
MWTVLGNPRFRPLFAAQVVALVGTGLLTVALGLLAYDLAGTDAGVVLGLALAIKMVAYVVVAPIMSAAAHRVPRRTLMVSADAVRAAVALALPFVDQVWQIYVLIAVLQSASATFTPAFQAVIPTVLPDERDYTRALSLSRLAYDLESVLSPVLAAAALLVTSYHSLFVGTLVGFLGSGLLVWRGLARRADAPTDHADAPNRRARVTAGARLMLADPVLRGLLWLNAVVASGTAVVLVATVTIVRDELGGGETAVALALACFGAGSMVTALALPRLLDRVHDVRPVMIVGAAAVATVLALVAVGFTVGGGWAVLATGWTLLGAATSAISTPTGRVLRDRTAEADRPLVFAAQFSLSHACFLVTYPLAGVLASTPVAAPATAAVLATLTAAAAARTWPRTVAEPVPV